MFSKRQKVDIEVGKVDIKRYLRRPLGRLCYVFVSDIFENL